MNLDLEKLKKLSGKPVRRGRYTLDQIFTLAEEVLNTIKWNGNSSLLFISCSSPQFAPLFEHFTQNTPQKVSSDKASALIYHSKKTRFLNFRNNFSLILAATDGRRSALLAVQSSMQSAPSSVDGEDALFDIIFTMAPDSIKRCLGALADAFENSDLKSQLVPAFNSLLPEKNHPDDWNLFGVDIARCSDQHFTTTLEAEAWTRFGFKLEEKLGELQKPEETLRAFSDRLKARMAYDYLEISFLTNSFEEDVEPANWVRNDTGLGGKLLSIILKDSFLRGLTRRRSALVVTPQKFESIIDNPELLRVMELHRGILVPLVLGSRTHGVMKLFFRRKLNFDAQVKEWLITSGAILTRSLIRSWRYLAAQKMATIDGLTGLYNHRYFMDQLRKEFTRARRYRNWLSLILIDIDNFKHYNDTNGHLAGNKALVKIAKTIRRSVREMDLVARWGGEEFALLLPEINAKNGMIVAEKIRKEVENQRFRNERKQPEGNLTISLGVAENSANLKNYLELFNRADEALYQAKRSGKNRCASAK